MIDINKIILKAKRPMQLFGKSEGGIKMDSITLPKIKEPLAEKAAQRAMGYRPIDYSGGKEALGRVWDVLGRPYYAINTMSKLQQEWGLYDLSGGKKGTPKPSPDEQIKQQGKAVWKGLSGKEKTKMSDVLDQYIELIPEKYWVAKGTAKTATEVADFVVDYRYRILGAVLSPVVKGGIKALPKWTKKPISQIFKKEVPKIPEPTHVSGAKFEFGKEKVAPMSEFGMEIKMEAQIMRQLYGADWVGKKAPKWVTRLAKIQTKKYLLGMKPAGTGITPAGQVSKLPVPYKGMPIKFDKTAVDFIKQMSDASRLKWVQNYANIVSRNPTIPVNQIIANTNSATGNIATAGISALLQAPKGEYGITPAGKLAPKVTLTTAPKITPKTPTEEVPSFLSPQTLQRMTGAVPEVAPLPPASAKDRITLTDLERRHLKAWEAKGIFGVTPKEEISTTRPEVRVYKPEAEKSLVEKYRETHGGEEPPLLNEAEVAREVEQVLAGVEPMPLPPREMGGLPEYLKPKGISTKIHSLYGRLEAKGISTRGISQEKTILKLIGKGQEQTAREAFKEGKTQGIIEQKDKFDDYIVRARWNENMRGRVEVARGKIGKAITMAKHHQLRPEAQRYIEGIMDKLDLSKPRTRTIYELQRMADFIKEHPEHNIPQHYIDKLQRLAKTPIQDLSVEEIEMIADETTAYVRQSALISKMIIKGRLREANKISTEAVANIQTKSTKIVYDPKEISSGDFEKRVGIFKQLAGVKSWNAELITEILDYKGTTQIHDIIYGGINSGTDKRLTYQNNAEDFISNEVQKAGIKNMDTWSRAIGGKRAKTIKVTISKDRNIRMTRGERVAFVLHSMNAKNVKHITRGGFAFAHNKTRIFRGITNDDINAIVKSATPEEMKMVGIIRKALDMMGIELNKTSMSLYGREIFKEPNYWRIRTNSLDRKVDALKIRSFGHKTLEGMGFLKERRNASNAIILEDAFSTLYKHIKQTSAFHGLAEPLRNAKMLLHDKNFKIAVMRYRGGQYWRALKRYLDDVEGMSVSTSDVEKIATGLINKIDLAVLGMNPFVMLKQPVSYMMAATEMPAKYLRRAVFTRPDFKEIAQWSPQLRDRLKGRITRELGELGQVGAVCQFFTGKSPLSHKVMEGIRFFDLQTIGRIWNATKFEIADLHPTLKGNEFMAKVKERAEEIIRKTQPTFMIKDRSEIGRDRSVFVRLLTKYTSQRNKNYIQLRRAWLKYETGGKGAKGKADLLKRWATIIVVNAVAIAGINEMRNIIYKRKRSPLSFALDTIGTALGNMYVVSDVFKSIASKFERGTTFGYDLNNPLSSAVGDVIDAIALTTRGIDQIVTGERYVSGKKKDELKWKSTMTRALDKALVGVSMFKGVPYRTIRSFIKGGYRWAKPEKTETQKTSGIQKDKIKLP